MAARAGASNRTPEGKKRELFFEALFKFCVTAAAFAGMRSRAATVRSGADMVRMVPLGGPTLWVSDGAQWQGIEWRPNSSKISKKITDPKKKLAAQKKRNSALARAFQAPRLQQPQFITNEI